MPLRFLERTSLAEHARSLTLASYTPELHTSGLLTGVDNVRHDVYLSAKFIEATRGHIADLIEKYGAVEDLVKEDPLANRNSGATGAFPAAFSARIAPRPNSPAPPKPADRAADFKRVLAELQVVSLNTAKERSNISVDILLRLAVLKVLRSELANQFGAVVERCRTKLKSYEGPRSGPKGAEFRDRFLKFQVAKKVILRKAANEIFNTLREVEKETVARMRRSLFGETESNAYELFLNRLIFTDEGRDDYLNAEHYVMLGNYDRDPDRFEMLDEIARDFLTSLEIGKYAQGQEEFIESVMNVPENAQELMGAGSPQEGTAKSKAQKALLAGWTNGLEQADVLLHIISSYEVAPLLNEYSPLINPQQLKSALISKSEAKRVEQLLEQHGRISPDKLQQAAKRVAGYSNAERARLAGRFLGDFMRYHRDVKRLEAVNAELDSVNVIANEKLRELSAINNTLYEFLLADEQRPTEEKVIDHIILKADIRESTTLTRTLFERGLNPASYFSLNFYEPINKLLPKYSATKVFIEGDAVILAMFEHEGLNEFGVARCCMLAREIIDVVNGYNEKSKASGLPSLELGIGICFQDSAPMYLMDGNNRIMISKALNESDRLSGCTKGARRFVEHRSLPFNVFNFQTVDDKDTGGMPEEFLMRYNIGGIHINQAAFQKLCSEISLQEHTVELPMLWGLQKVKLYSGLVPVTAGVFHRIIVREGVIPHINATEFTVTNWTDRNYYEICTDKAVYNMLDPKAVPA
jgi:hypothetical protein